MANAINNISSLSNAQITNGTSNDTKTKEVGKDAFLKLLVAQLKNQDPLDPQDQGQFAVDLAQFSQVEQLTEINKKLDQNSSGSGALGLASYLGHEVVLKDQSVQVSGTEAGSLQIDPAVALANLKVDLLDANGNIAGSKTFVNLPAGKQSISLDEIGAPSGSYAFKLSGSTTNGTPLTLEGKVAGIVSGFIPGPEQTLIVGGREVTLEDIAEVHIAK